MPGKASVFPSTRRGAPVVVRLRSASGRANLCDEARASPTDVETVTRPDRDCAPVNATLRDSHAFRREANTKLGRFVWATRNRRAALADRSALKSSGFYDIWHCS